MQLKIAIINFHAKCFLHFPSNITKGNCTLSVYNPTGIKIDQFSDLEIRKGFVQGNFNLIDGTEPGVWNLD